MAAATVYLLDTNIALHLVRGSEFGTRIAASFGLLHAVYRPLVSIVTHGELLVMADRRQWGEPKRNALANMLGNLVTIDINDQSVLEAYVEVQRISRQARGGSRELKANDAWIAACARAANATLLTTDKDFTHLAKANWAIHVVA